MIFRLINFLVLGIALFYVLEGTGLIERGKYFPTLPRLEASAGDPRAWLGAAEWGISHLVGAASSRGVAMPSMDGNAFVKKLAEQRKITDSFLSGGSSSY